MIGKVRPLTIKIEEKAVFPSFLQLSFVNTNFIVESVAKIIVSFFSGDTSFSWCAIYDMLDILCSHDPQSMANVTMATVKNKQYKKTIILH